MIEVLDPLSKTPGVRLAVLVAPDGVPVAMRGEQAEPTEESAELAGENADSLAALATSWLCELARSVAPLSWEAPHRVVLRAARGTLVMLAAPGAVLLVVCDRGASPDELRLPMEATVARMGRVLRGMGRREPQAAPASQPEYSEPEPLPPELGAALPYRIPVKGPSLIPADSSPTQSPHASGQD